MVYTSSAERDFRVVGRKPGCCSDPLSLFTTLPATFNTRLEAHARGASPGADLAQAAKVVHRRRVCRGAPLRNMSGPTR